MRYSRLLPFLAVLALGSSFLQGCGKFSNVVMNLIPGGEGRDARRYTKACTDKPKPFPHDCEWAFEAAMRNGEKEKAIDLHRRYRAAVLDIWCDRETDTVECAARMIWWSEDAKLQQRGLGSLALLCATGADATACVHLGDAYALGRGATEDPEAALAAWSLGCKGANPPAEPPALRPAEDSAGEERARIAEWHVIDSSRGNAPAAQDVNCRRLSSPSSLYDDVEPYPDTVHLVRPNAQARLTRARSLVAAGNDAAASWLLASVTGSRREGGPSAEAATLLQPLAERQWEAKVAPAARAHHFVRALAAAMPIAASFPPDSEFHARVAKLVQTATAHHGGEASKAGPLVAAVNRAIAHRIDPTLPSAGALPRGSTSVSLDLTTLAPDCTWASALLQEAFATDHSGASEPVRFAVTCAHSLTLETPTTFPLKYTETAYRKEMGQVRGKPETVREEYQCIQPKRVRNSNGGWDTIQVWGVCYRDVEKATWVPGEVTVAYQAERERTGTRQSRTLVADIHGTLQVGTLPSIAVSATKRLQETAVSNAGAADVPFTAASLDTLDREAVAELANEIRAQMSLFGPRREKAVALDAKRLADTPSPERDEAFIGALLLDDAPAQATTWLDERFGITPAELRALLSGR